MHVLLHGYNPTNNFNIREGHLPEPLWQLVDENKILTGEHFGLGGCKVTVLIGDMYAGIPAAYLQNPKNFTLKSEQYTYETDSSVITSSRVIVTVNVPFGFVGLNIQPGNEITMPTILPNEAMASTLDFYKYIVSLGGDPSKIWVKYNALDTISHNLAILDVIAPITDWRYGNRSSEHLNTLYETMQMSAQPGQTAYETIKLIVCGAAAEAGYKEINSKPPNGTPTTLPACEVHINFVSPNPQDPNGWYQLDSIPASGFPEKSNVAGWTTYITNLRPVINSKDFETYNLENAYVIYEPQINQTNWLTQLPQMFRQWAP